MQKDFWAWHKYKNKLNDNKERLNFNEKEVWFAAVGMNIGFEQNGKGLESLRPIIVLKKFNNGILWAVPTTSKYRDGKYYFRFQQRKGSFSTAILSQIRLIDSKRLDHRIGYINEKDFIEIKERIISLLR